MWLSSFLTTSQRVRKGFNSKPRSSHVGYQSNTVTDQITTSLHIASQTTHTYARRSGEKNKHIKAGNVCERWPCTQSTMNQCRGKALQTQCGTHTHTHTRARTAVAQFKEIKAICVMSSTTATTRSRSAEQRHRINTHREILGVKKIKTPSEQ